MKILTRLIGLCLAALVCPAALGGTFVDHLTNGLDSKYWTVTQTTAGLYSVAPTNVGIELARSSSGLTTFQNVTISLNLAAAIGQSSIAGDFSTQIDFANAVVTGPGLDQAEFHTFYNGGSDQSGGRASWTCAAMTDPPAPARPSRMSMSGITTASSTGILQSAAARGHSR